jgi:ketosteroid isomerase-like protein
MRRTLLLLLTLALGLPLLAGGGRSSDDKLEKERAQLVVKKYVEALETEDVEALSQLFVQDADLVTISVHLPEIGVGPKILEATAKGWFDAVKDIDVTVKNEVIKMSQKGNAAWVSFTLDGSHSVSNRQGRSEFKGMRVTWGLEKRKDRYIIVQGHWSFVFKDPRV